jgi:hypothetical protein
VRYSVVEVALGRSPAEVCNRSDKTVGCYIRRTGEAGERRESNVGLMGSWPLVMGRLALEEQDRNERNGS